MPRLYIEYMQVASPTNDKSLDITGISQNGITTVKEVIQVKRNTISNIMYPILDSFHFANSKVSEI